jgi:hypothetical protein
MSFFYLVATFAEIIALFVSCFAVVFLVLRAIVRLIVAPKLPTPKKEDLRYLKRAGQSGFY